MAALVALSVSGCASTSITQLWRDPGYASTPEVRVFIIAAMPGSANPAQFERALAQALTAKGFQASTYLSVFPPGRVDKLAVKKYVADNRIDLLIMERLTTEAAAPVVVTSTVAQSSGWYGSYGAVASTSTVVSQGTDVTARIEVFDVRTEPDTLVWSGQSNAVDLTTAAQSLSAVLTEELMKARILVK
jgi:hypothetical protein